MACQLQYLRLLSLIVLFVADLVLAGNTIDLKYLSDVEEWVKSKGCTYAEPVELLNARVDQPEYFELIQGQGERCPLLNQAAGAVYSMSVDDADLRFEAVRGVLELGLREIISKSMPMFWKEVFKPFLIIGSQTDFGYMRAYYKFVLGENPFSTGGLKLKNGTLAGLVATGDLCKGVKLDGVAINGTSWLYPEWHNCRMENSNGDRTLFAGFFDNHSFKNMSLRGAKFRLRDLGGWPSHIKFENCDLRGAQFIASNMQFVFFKESNLQGAVVNGRTCTGSDISTCR